MIQTKTRVISNIQVASNYFLMSLEAPKISRQARPGQFLHIRCSDNYRPLLRRPFSIHRINKNQVGILFEVVGEGTRLLSKKIPGDKLDILGPLGNGFNLPLPIPGHRVRAILAAGGIGVAPLFFLAEELVRTKNKEQRAKINILLGANTKSSILCEKEFRRLGCDVHISTEDGSYSFKGKVTDLLRHLLSTYQHINLSTIYACGPRSMLKDIAAISRSYNIAFQASLEENMACGLGACLGCVIKTSSGYKRVCKDGPVFNASEIIWKEWCEFALSN